MINSFSLAVRKARRRLCMWRADSILFGLFFFIISEEGIGSALRRKPAKEKVLETKVPGTVLSD